jgi:hypothetical protein
LRKLRLRIVNPSHHFLRNPIGFLFIFIPSLPDGEFGLKGCPTHSQQVVNGLIADGILQGDQRFGLVKVRDKRGRLAAIAGLLLGLVGFSRGGVRHGIGLLGYLFLLSHCWVGGT